MTGARRSAVGLALAGALLGVSGCATSVDPIERLGRKAAVELRELGELREQGRNDPVRRAVSRRDVPPAPRRAALNWHSA